MNYNRYWGLQILFIQDSQVGIQIRFLWQHIMIQPEESIYQMKVFIISSDESGSRRTARLSLTNCQTTTALNRQISRLLGVARSLLIVRMKYEPVNLRIVDGWPLHQYPIKNGSAFEVEIDSHKSESETDSMRTLDKIEEEQDDDDNFSSDSAKLSFISEDEHANENKYLDGCLESLLEAVRTNHLDQIASILKAEPELDNKNEVDRIMRIKDDYLLNQLGECGQNALHWAIHQKNEDIVSFLLIKGADPKITTLQEYTPLQLAVLQRSLPIVSLLLAQQKADVNQVTAKGTALHLGVINEDLQCIELLLQKGADFDVPNQEGKKPIQVCKNTKIKEMLKDIIKYAKARMPNITMGSILKVSLFSYRHKERMMTLNPYNDELLILKEKEVEDLLAISSLTNVGFVVQKSWRMKEDLFYVKVQAKKQMLVAFRNKQMALMWIQKIKLCARYVANSRFNQPVPVDCQIIETLDDVNNKVQLNRRRREDSRNSISIMSLEDITDLKTTSKGSITTTTRKRSQTAEDGHYLSQSSQILLGSILEETNHHSKSASPTRQFSLNFPLTHSSGSVDFIDKKIVFSSPGLNSSVSPDSFKKNEQRYSQVSQFKSEPKVKVSYQDFSIKRMLGNGAFGKVYLAKHRTTNKFYALKVLNKKKLLTKKHLKYAVSQANILKKIKNPFIIKLYYAFQTEVNLYMALDNCTNGDLAELITVKERLSESTARFIIAQIILAVQYLHANKILYRDLKPENVLIAKNGYICLTDFGLSKEKNFSSSFCGSPAYLSPQMLDQKGASFCTDIYGIGCVLHEMLIGEPPYFDENIDILYQNIRNGRLRFPSDVTIQAKSLINRLLERDITKRIGTNGIEEIKSHEFFASLDWQKISLKMLQPPPQMFLNQQEKYEELIALESNDEIAFTDRDYEGEGRTMLNRIKNFTFVHESVSVIP